MKVITEFVTWGVIGDAWERDGRRETDVRVGSIWLGST
jgi:hypothetical protein